MDVTSLIAIFLAFTMVTVVMNTFLIFFAYKAFAGVTMKVTEAVTEVETSSSTREWIASLEKAAEQAVLVTETAKQKLLEYDPVLDNLEGRYGYMLAKVDVRVENLTDTVSETAIRVRDAIAVPAEKLEMVTEALRKAAAFISPDATPKP